MLLFMMAFTFMKFSIVLFALLPLQLVAAQTSTGLVGFANPSKQYRPKFRYWLPDASVPPASVATDIANVTSIGAAGVEFIPFYLYGLPQGGPPPTNWSEYGFGTPAYNEVFQAALQATKDNGGLMDMAQGANQGQGVPSVPGIAGLAVQLLAGNASVKGGQKFQGPVPPPSPIDPTLASGLGYMHPIYQAQSPNLTAVIAIEISSTGHSGGFNPFTMTAYTFPTYSVNESSIEDLTNQVHNGNLTWTAPTGTNTWRILSFWESYTNQRSCSPGLNATTFIGNGSWAVDHFSSNGAKHVTDFLDQHIFSDDTIAALVKEVGKYAWEDSVEILSTLYWTPGLLDEFERMKGYSLTKYLPLLYTVSNSWNSILLPYAEEYIYGNYTADNTSVYNIDYRNVLNSGYQAYVNHFVQWSTTKGLSYSNQPAYNLPLDMAADVPLPAAPELESLGFNDNLDAYRQFSGPAHLAHKSVISTEVGAVSGLPYTLTVPNLLRLIKRSWAGGVTMSIIHGSNYGGNYVNTTWPGYVTFGFMYSEMWNHLQPAWIHMKDALNYVARNQWVLQQGTLKVDIAFYLYEDPYSAATQYQSSNLQNLGYTYEYLGPSNFQLPSAVVTNKVLAVDGPAYKALVFSNQTIVGLTAAQSLLRFAKQGLPVFFIGHYPNQTRSASDAIEAQTSSVMQQVLVASANVHKLNTVTDLPAALSRAGIISRIQANCSSSPVYTVWRSSNQTEYAFIFNDQNADVTCTFIFATVEESASPNLLDAWNGGMTPLSTYQRPSTHSISTQMTLKANATAMIAFLPPSSSTSVHVRNSSTNVTSISTTNTSINFTLIGNSQITLSNSTSLTLHASPPKATSLTHFNLTVTSWHAPTNAAERFEVRTEKTDYNFNNITLQSWNKISSSLRNVSGVGRYTTTFTTPRSYSQHPLGAIISLPVIQNTARVFLNAQQLPAIDPVNPTLDISAYLAPPGGSNTLIIQVTTTLINAVRAAAQGPIDSQPLFIGVPIGKIGNFTAVPVAEYGLVGEVGVQWVERVELVL